MPQPQPGLTHPSDRVAGVDAYRGLVMFLMMAEVLRFSRVAAAVPDSGVLRFLALHQTHVEWTGCTLHDLIQPSFSFLVGVALPFSLAGRIQRGQSTLAMLGHAAWRAFLLTALGVFLRSHDKVRTYFTFEDTLSQIGLGYLPLFCLGLLHVRWRWVALVAILVGYWLAFVGYPLPGPEFDYAAVGVAADWPHRAEGLAAHFNKNSNLAWAFDTWFLNLFPRETPFAHNRGGYATLSFIPTLATMILGLIAGGWLKGDSSVGHKLGRLVLAGVVCLGLGFAADRFGVCPSVKRIWTPAWVLLSGGWCFLFLAAFYAVCDGLKFRAWAFPLLVIGANSIVAYCIAHWTEGFFAGSFKTHFGRDAFERIGGAYAPLIEGAAVLACFCGVLFWMYRHRIFVRI